ncbi:Transcription intermediary factor 1-alpha [Mactra antiquata]
MASGVCTINMSEETFDFLCTSCAESGFIKEALKYCIDCQLYCCRECLTAHARIPVLKGHSFLDNSSNQPQGQPRSLPAFPTKKCNKHAGKIMDMFCRNHDVVCCYICAAEDHRSCADITSISDNIDQLYSKVDTFKTNSDLSALLDDMNERQNNTDDLLQKLRDSKEAAIKIVGEFRAEMETFLRKLEEASIHEIENEFIPLESLLLVERKIYEDSIDSLEKLKKQLIQSSGNLAQLFVCTKLIEKDLKAIETDRNPSSIFRHAEVTFQPSDDLKASLENMTCLGITSASSARINDLYKVKKIRDVEIKLKDDSHNGGVCGSCIVDDTLLFTDFWNNTLKRLDILSLSLKDYCKVPDNPRGVCSVGNEEVAVACRHVVQFVSIRADRLLLSRTIKMKHKSYGIAYGENKLYITDESKSLYVYDMSGKLLKKVTDDCHGQPLFTRANHIVFDADGKKIFIGDDYKGLVCFDAQCDYIETIEDQNVAPDGVCMDNYGNVIIANYRSKIIFQIRGDGQRMGIIVNQAECEGRPRSVRFHTGLKCLFVGSEVLRAYYLH